MKTLPRCAVALVLAGAVGFGACGDDESGSASGADTDTETDHAHTHVEDEHADHGGDEEADFAMEDADVTVKVAMKDFAFSGIPGEVKGRNVLFEVTNEGPSRHELLVLEKGGEEVVRGMEPFVRGKTQMLAAELAPGSYTAKCLVKLGDQTHADLGMQTDFTVG